MTSHRYWQTLLPVLDTRIEDRRRFTRAFYLKFSILEEKSAFREEHNSVDRNQPKKEGYVVELKAIGCPLCNLHPEKEKKYYEDKSFIVLKTKTSKGHKERIMIVYRPHEHVIPQKTYEHALDILEKIGRQIFSYTPKFVIMDTTFATINDHWHLVATDLDPKSEDFNQILTTKWIRIIDNAIPDDREL